MVFSFSVFQLAAHLSCFQPCQAECHILSVKTFLSSVCRVFATIKVETHRHGKSWPWILKGLSAGQFISAPVSLNANFLTGTLQHRAMAIIPVLFKRNNKLHPSTGAAAASSGGIAAGVIIAIVVLIFIGVFYHYWKKGTPSQSLCLLA
ncbi:hypothetical protein BX600DRAFT_53625 [Xylariales sp. PMI_506]|nr:hypothetical protein BX600DRAFT_53625 [Xylariales sp. PMI_506]